MIRVYLAQANYRFGENAFLPYSVGRLWAYAQRDPVIRGHYELGRLIAFREDPSGMVTGFERPFVLGLSCYVWNWEWSLAAARQAREAGGFAVLGGPHVPDRETARFLDEHPYVDALVHGEGEVTFTELLRARAEGRDLRTVSGLSLPGVGRTGPNARADSLDDMPSPYLEGLMDGFLFDEPGTNWHVLQETHRGCPYSCAFCDWGSAVFTKLRQVPTDLIKAELDWAAEKRIELIYNADANFLILKRDAEIVDHLIALKRERGAPQKIRASYAKKTTPQLFEQACRLAESGMSKGVTISFQSLDDATLDAVKRKNIAFDGFKELLDRYKARGVPTYTEMICGLPGETYDTFVDGLCALLDAGQHDGLNVYPCVALPNSEMTEPAYVERYGIKTQTVDQLLLHGSPTPDGHPERYDLVIETSTMPHADWRRAMIFAWMLQACHCLGPTQLVARKLVDMGLKTYREFYESLFLSQPGTVVGSIRNQLHQLLNNVLKGSAWNTVVPGCGDVLWPPEEMLFLQMTRYRDRLYEELTDELWNHLEPAGPWDGSWKTWLRSFLEDQKRAVRWPRPAETMEDYAREVVWYGRKGSTMLQDHLGLQP